MPLARGAGLLSNGPVTPPRQSGAKRFAEQLRGLRSEEQGREASDLAVATLDEWLRSESFSDLEELLETLDPAHLHPAATLAILAVTHPARGQLEKRELFVARAVEALPGQLGDPKRAERLLAPCL